MVRLGAKDRPGEVTSGLNHKGRNAALVVSDRAVVAVKAVHLGMKWVRRFSSGIGWLPVRA
jgi:hypothetical protein